MARQSYALDQADQRWATFVSQDGDRLQMRKVEFNRLEQPASIQVEVTVPKPGPKRLTQPKEENTDPVS